MKKLGEDKVMETNPIWYIVFWSQIIGIIGSLVIVTLVININYYFKNKKSTR
jgi:hypothetical protein